MVGFCERLPSHPTRSTLSDSPTRLLIGRLTRLPFPSGYVTASSTYPVIGLQLRFHLPGIFQQFRLNYRVIFSSIQLPLTHGNIFINPTSTNTMIFSSKPLPMT